jgi:hypothetical protein
LQRNCLNVSGIFAVRRPVPVRDGTTGAQRKTTSPRNGIESMVSGGGRTFGSRTSEASMHLAVASFRRIASKMKFFAFVLERSDLACYEMIRAEDLPLGFVLEPHREIFLCEPS